MGYRDRLRDAVAAVADRRVLASLDAALLQASHAYGRTLDTAVKLADAATVRWRPSPPTTTVTQIVPVNVSTWSVGDINATLDSHELGQFMDSCTLMDAMGRDDRITGCLGTRVRALAGKSGVGFSVEPSGKGTAGEAAEYAKLVGDLWYYCCPENVMHHILRDAVMLGVAVARIHWELVDGWRVPRLEPWDLRGIYWDWSIRRYRAIAMEGVFTVDPSSAEWFVFEPGGYRSWMNGAIRGLGLPFIVRKMTFRDWSRYSEKHGIPILAVKEPTGHQWEKQKQGFWARMRALGAETTLRLPRDDKDYGFDVDLIEAKARSHDAFRLLIERLDINIAVMLLGQNLSTEVNGGSYAAAQAHNLIRLDYLDADAQTLSTALREQVWKAFLRFNIPGVDEEETPWARWQTKPPDDLEANAKIFETVATGLTNLAKAGYYPPTSWVEANWKIPLTVGDPTDEAGGAAGDRNDGGGSEAPVASPGTKGTPPASVVPKGGAGGKAVRTKPSRDAAAKMALATARNAGRVIALAAGSLQQRTIAGIPIVVDRPAGTVQTGTAPDGSQWSRTYQVDYGFIPTTLGGDGEELDVYCGPDDAAPEAYWILQRRQDGSFDEFKLMLGFSTQGAALECYLQHVPADRLGQVIAMPVDAVRALLGLEPRQRSEALRGLSAMAGSGIEVAVAGTSGQLKPGKPARCAPATGRRQPVAKSRPAPNAQGG